MTRFLMIPLMFIMVACTVPGTTVEPQTPNERLVVLESSYNGALLTVNNMIATGVINPGNVDEVVALMKQAKAAVDAARVSIKAGDPNATDVLSIADAMILQLVLYLQQRTPQPGTPS